MNKNTAGYRNCPIKGRGDDINPQKLPYTDSRGSNKYLNPLYVNHASNSAIQSQIKYTRLYFRHFTVSAP